ncbi:MAG TPA: HDOD domain-containing protein [Cellvibrionaceae bacterium]
MSSSYPLLARQPIFDSNMDVFAYELLYRSNLLNQAHVIDNGDSASTQVLLSTFADLSIDKVVGKKLAFINFTTALLDSHIPFDTTQLVIEVLETEAVSASLLHRLKVLREQGFTIALDDFELNENTEALIAYADIIKLDVLALSHDTLIEHINYLKPLGVQLLAEKIETFSMLEQCKRWGFDYFQGYFLERPQVIRGKRLSENKQAVIQLLGLLNDGDASFEEIERIIAHDPILSFKLLRMVNSAAFGLPRTIESLRQAITLLGLKIIKNWVGLLAMANLGDKPQELSVKALARAKFCEQIAASSRPLHQCDQFFTAGLLSTLDAFMDMPLAELLADIHLSDALRAALLQGSGEEGKILQAAIAYEHGAWESIDWVFLQQQGIDEPNKLTDLYLQTLQWADDTRSVMHAL